jgi:hypothetical protein
MTKAAVKQAARTTARPAMIAFRVLLLLMSGFIPLRASQNPAGMQPDF